MGKTRALSKTSEHFYLTSCICFSFPTGFGRNAPFRRTFWEPGTCQESCTTAELPLPVVSGEPFGHTCKGAGLLLLASPPDLESWEVKISKPATWWPPKGLLNLLLCLNLGEGQQSRTRRVLVISAQGHEIRGHPAHPLPLEYHHAPLHQGELPPGEDLWPKMGYPKEVPKQTPGQTPP